MGGQPQRASRPPARHLQTLAEIGPRSAKFGAAPKRLQSSSTGMTLTAPLPRRLPTCAPCCRGGLMPLLLHGLPGARHVCALSCASASCESPQKSARKSYPCAGVVRPICSEFNGPRHIENTSNTEFVKCTIPPRLAELGRTSTRWLNSARIVRSATVGEVIPNPSIHSMFGQSRPNLGRCGHVLVDVGGFGSIQMELGPISHKTWPIKLWVIGPVFPPPPYRPS